MDRGVFGTKGALSISPVQIFVRVAAFGVGLGAIGSVFIFVAFGWMIWVDFCLLENECEQTPMIEKVAGLGFVAVCLLLAGAIAVVSFNHAFTGWPARIPLWIAVLAAGVVAVVGLWFGVPLFWWVAPPASLLVVALGMNATSA